MNMSKLFDHGYLFSAISLAVYSQCIIRWQLQLHSDIPVNFWPKLKYICVFLIEPWVLSSIMATFFAGIFWIAALSKFELNYAYPWMALIFVIMMFMGGYLFDELITVNKVLGTALVVAGLIIIARG